MGAAPFSFRTLALLDDRDTTVFDRSGKDGGSPLMELAVGVRFGRGGGLKPAVESIADLFGVAGWVFSMKLGCPSPFQGFGALLEFRAAPGGTLRSDLACE